MTDIYQIIENNGTPKNIEDKKARTNIAPYFNVNNANAAGDLILSDTGILYKFNSAYSAGTSWNSRTSKEQVNIDNELKNRVINSNISDNFNTTTAYKIGDIVIYDGKLYKFTATHSAGAWIGTDAVQVTVDDELLSLDLKEKNVLTANDDLNNLFTGGIYYVVGTSSVPLNAPTGTDGLHSIITVINGKDIQDYTEVLQTYYVFANGTQEWRRRWWNNEWTQWNKIYTKSEIDSLFVLDSYSIVVTNLTGGQTVSVPSQTLSKTNYKPLSFTIIPGGWGDLCGWSWGSMAISGNTVVTGTGIVHNNNATATWEKVYFNIKVLWMKIQ